MAYPTDPVSFVPVTPGENRTDVANLLGAEITAIETALLHSAGQTAPPMRLRQGGNLLEWGPTAAGKLSVLGSTNGRSFLGLGCEVGSTPGTYTTRAQAGIVVTTDGSGGVVVQSVPAVGVADQTPVQRFAVARSAYPILSNPVLGIWSNGALSVPSSSSAWTNMVFPVVNDPWGFYLNDASGTFKIPPGLAGVYLWIAAPGWPANATGNRGGRFNHSSSS